ncbi:MAG: hypothetical protein K8H84_01335 [Sulfuricella denitrificans]|nr:hypothetical protein [Sulfuricella denitrificans]
MKPAILLLAALLLPTSAAIAANWHLVQNTPQMLLEADDPQPEATEGNSPAKAGKKDKKLKIWSKSAYSRPEQARPGDFYYSSDKALMEINCTNRTYRLLQKIYYAAEGQEIKSVQQVDGGKTEPIVPDSTEDRISGFACSYQPPKADLKTVRKTPSKPAVSASQAAAPEKPSKKSDTKAEAKAPEKKKPATAKPKGSSAEKPQH